MLKGRSSQLLVNFCLSLSVFSRLHYTLYFTLADVNRDLKVLETQGFRYVFLDEGR